MTTRIFDFQRTARLTPAAIRSQPRPRTKVALGGAALTVLFVAPVAGVGEGPTGLLVAAASGLLMLHLAAILGSRLRWGWLAILLALLGLMLPRGQWPAIGPALFVTTAVSLAVWFAARDNNRRKRQSDRPPVGTRERAAREIMGLSGERHVGEVLAAELPQDYAVFNGVSVPRCAGDIDHLVVGPSGVFVLETKTMAGHIVCEADGQWRRTRIGRAGTSYSAYIGDPAAQVQRNVFALRQTLRRRLPALFARSPLWIEGLVVFAHPDTHLEAAASRVPALVLEQATQRIRRHTPRRPLAPAEVDQIVAALLDEARAAQNVAAVRQSAQALVELALVLPLVLAVLLGTVAVSRVVQARAGVIAVAHEAARAAALGNNPGDAVGRMRERTDLVAPGLGLDPASLVLSWDLTRFSADPAQVTATVDYPVDLADLPLVGGLPAPVVHAQHTEWIDPFRSGMAAPAGVTN
jgi:nuclease-like protein/TadE-like protein